MPAFSAASGSFHVKSSFTNLVTVFVTVRLLPSFSTFTLIRSSTLIVSTFDARSYTDQRYWSIHSSVRMHSSEASSGLTFASGSASGTLVTGSTTVALAPGSASAVLSSGPASAASEWASAAIASRGAIPALTCRSRFAGATHSSTAKLQHRKQPNPLKSLYLLPILYPLVISSKGKPAVVTLQPELRKFERLAHAKSGEPGRVGVEAFTNQATVCSALSHDGLWVLAYWIFADRVLADWRRRRRGRLLARQIGGSGNAQHGDEPSRYDYNGRHDANPLVLGARTGRPSDAPIPLCLCKTPASTIPRSGSIAGGMAPDYWSPRPVKWFKGNRQDRDSGNGIGREAPT